MGTVLMIIVHSYRQTWPPDTWILYNRTHGNMS